MTSKIINAPSVQQIKASELERGQFAKMRYDGEEHIVFGCYDSLISLSGNDFLWNPIPPTICQIIPFGTVIEITT